MSTDRRSRIRFAPFSSIALLAACNGTSSYLDATGRAGRSEGKLGVWLTAISCAVVIIVCIAVVAGIMRHRGERETNASVERTRINSGLGWIYVGTGTTIVVLVAVFVATMVTLTAATHPPSVPSLTMDITGHQWWWEVTYSDASNPELGFTTANEVHLPVGIPVRVRLHSTDVIHSFWLPQIAGKMDVIPGQTNEMWLEAERAGTSRGMCGEYCGLQHAAMAFAVTAESPAAFNKWAQQRRSEAPAPATREAVVGQTVFFRSCGACHTISGTPALGRLAPELTHFASRPTIGAGALENTPANLARWIENAPTIKEGARMPAIPLDAAELRAVVAYLETLE
ncbi:MAG TPA: cytochrome c oxidase subunit II [Gemmatimonadaceae bacterium]|jgi:cytochrome c oxidase subunit 2|nr:cytochrome c oxidase subunit II [Gemmatimonadaceae bacterium]